jgi:hypothetical protein
MPCAESEAFGTKECAPENGKIMFCYYFIQQITPDIALNNGSIGMYNKLCEGLMMHCFFQMVNLNDDANKYKLLILHNSVIRSVV